MENRLFYLDRLKVFLTVLVVLHHTSIIYGGAGSWYYYEPQDSIVAQAILSTFTAVNQSFFMGLFFFVSGYVTPASFDRQGSLSFLKSRLLRFGIPILFYMLILVPLLGYVSTGYDGSFVSFFKEQVLPSPLQGIQAFAVGPLWYLEALLIFYVGYALYRKLFQGRPRRKPLMLTPRLMTGYVAFVVAANFLVRLVYPVGTEWLNLQLGYFPAYIGLFMAGIAAYRGNWLQQLDERTVRKWRWPVLLMILMLPAGMALGGALEGDTSVFMGGMSWQAAFYAVLDPLMGLGISLLLLIWFRNRRNGTMTRFTGWLSAHAFLVYILHALVVTYTAFAFRHLIWPPMLKFVLVGSIAVVLTYSAASLLRRISLVKKVV
ncbi:acyltransferase family protein [Paenibacillus koleovorans]|uniref:acyltransferase family protein n=1 Tax=Paenibacillus koleovorans TaxID=121608 RepID=UPI000FDA3CB3|nr:acyltransferase [Paenibacillus koleovorans]